MEMGATRIVRERSRDREALVSVSMSVLQESRTHLRESSNMFMKIIEAFLPQAGELELTSRQCCRFSRTLKENKTKHCDTMR
jgi:hypothetical protein